MMDQILWTSQYWEGILFCPTFFLLYLFLIYDNDSVPADHLRWASLSPLIFLPLLQFNICCVTL